MRLQIVHADGRLETITHVAGLLRRGDGSVLDGLRAVLPPGADLLEPGEHRPATSRHQPDPIA